MEYLFWNTFADDQVVFQNRVFTVINSKNLKTKIENLYLPQNGLVVLLNDDNTFYIRMYMYVFTRNICLVSEI